MAGFFFPTLTRFHFLDCYFPLTRLFSLDCLRFLDTLACSGLLSWALTRFLFLDLPYFAMTRFSSMV